MRKQEAENGDQTYDFVVVGGGSAGCVVASRLSENGRYSVCLLEAGGTHKSSLVEVPFNLALTVSGGLKNWAFQTVPQAGLNGRSGYQPRGRVMGGSSSINAMIYIRGVAQDYDGWAAAGNTGWAFEDVLPYFLKSEDHIVGADPFHATGGPLSVAPVQSPNPLNDVFIEAAQQVQVPRNQDFNGRTQEGVGYYEVTQKNGRRCSSAHAFIDPAKDRKNLTIIHNAHVRRLGLADRRVAGVIADCDGRRVRFRANREVILCAGALQTPQILLLSGIGSGEKLTPHGLPVRHELNGVGENLHDHPDYALMYRTRSKHAFAYNARSAVKIARGLFAFSRLNNGLLTTNFNESGAFLRTRKSEATPDVQLHFVFALVDNHGRKMHWQPGITCHVCVLRPKSRGRVSLFDPDPLAAPSIDPAFLQHEDDMRTMLLGVTQAQRILNAPAFEVVRGDPLYGSDETDLDRLEEDVRNRADTIYHPVGTCRMGSDPDAVVDHRLKVHGLEALRIADASIMPTIVSGNTNAPTIMIGEKCAAMVLEDMRADGF